MTEYLVSSQSNFTSNSTESTTFPTTINYDYAFREEAPAFKTFRIVYMSLTTLASLLGNTIMLITASTFPSRTPLPYYLVTNLAAAEIIHTLTSVFTFIYVYESKWSFGEFDCKFAVPLKLMSLSVVTNKLAATAVYRFVFIAFQFRITVTYRKLILFLSPFWLFALVMCMPHFLARKLLHYEGKQYCAAVLLRGMNFYNYEIARFILTYSLPCLVMVISYSVISALKLRTYSKRIRKEAAEMSALGKKTQEEDEPTQQQDTEAIEPRKSTRAVADLENDLLRMIYVVIIVFAVCYLPYQVYYLFAIFGWFERYPEARKYRRIIQQYCVLLASLSSALIPLCYGTMSKFYARSFSWLVLCRCKSAN